MNIEQEILVKQKHAHAIRLIVCIVALLLFAIASYILITRPSQALTSPWSPTNMTSIQSTGPKSCAIESGKVYCWGTGVLGNGTNGTSAVPVAVDTSTVLAGKTVTKLVMSGPDSCVLTSDAGVYCWGTNVNGAVGNGTTTASLYPVSIDRVGALATQTITDIQANDSGTFFLIASGQLYGWGYNGAANIGSGTQTNQSSPVATDISGALSGKNIKLLSYTGESTCVVTTTNDIACWGRDGSGRLGDGTIGDDSQYATSPVLTDQTSDIVGKTVTAISKADMNTCTVADGVPYCWGYNSDGETGQGYNSNWTPSPSAVKTSGALLGKIVTKTITASRGSCALTSDGGVYCWGKNVFGMNGDGTTAETSSPKSIDTSGALAGKSVSDIFKAPYAVYAVADGQLYAWGYNPSGSLGINDSYFLINTPTLVGSTGPMSGKSVNFIQPYEGASATCAIAGGQPYCWGANAQNQLGDGTTTSTISPVSVQIVSPELTSISKTGALLDGSNQTMTLYGQDFQAGVVVTFGSSVATITGATNTTIDVEIPQPAITQATIVDVTVTNRAGLSSTLNDAFTFTIPAPIIDSVSPAQMNATPGAASKNVSIYGSYFVVGTQASIGGTVLATTVVNSGELEVVVPSPAVTADQTVAITVINPDGQNAVLPGAFTYLALKPSLTSINRAPDIYLAANRVNQIVTLTGAHFDGATVTSNLNGMSYDVVSDTSITLTLPTNAITQTQPLNVSVTNEYGVTTVFSNVVTLHVPRISSVSFATVAGQNQLVVSGVSFPADGGQVTASLVSLGDVALPFCSTNTGVDAAYFNQYLAVAPELVSDTPACYLIMDADQNPVFTKTQVIILLPQAFDTTTPGKIAVLGSSAFLFNTPVVTPTPPVVPKPTIKPTVAPSVASIDTSTPENTKTIDQLVAAVTVSSGDQKLTNNPTLSSKPTFSGRAPAGSTVIVTVHSDPVTCTTKANQDGVWTCTLAENLPAGDHTVAVAVTTPQGAKTTLGPYDFAVTEVAGADNTVNEPIATLQKYLPWVATAIGLLIVVGIIASVVHRKKTI